MTQQPITSRRNPRVVQAARLRTRRERSRTGRFLIDGFREFRLALGANVAISELFFCPALAPAGELDAAIAALTPGTQVCEVTPEVFGKLAFGDRAKGIVAVARMPDRKLMDLQLPDRPLVAVLENVEKPGNVGAVLRSADAAGVSAVVVVGGTDLYNPNTVRASLGTIFTAPVCTASAEETLAWLRDRGIAMFAARVDAQRPYTTALWTGPAAILLGAEAAGLSAIWSGGDVTNVAIPMRGVADSLNVSTAAAVLFYEALRQRIALAENDPAAKN